MKKKQTPSQNQILDFVVGLTAGNRDEIGFETDLIECGLLDSIVMMELLLWLEKDFDMFISEDDMLPANFRTIAKLHEFLTRPEA